MPAFSIPLRKLAEKRKADLQTITGEFTHALFQGVILKTPVGTGRARANWNVSQGEPDTTVTDSTDSARGTDEASKALSYKAGGVVYLTNALPYIRVLEYGEYPNPPKSGTKTKGGYSIQAPQGMVRVTIAEIKGNIDRILK